MGSVFGTLRSVATYILTPRAGVAFAFRVKSQGTAGAGEGVRCSSRAESSMESSVGHVAVDIQETCPGGGGAAANASDVGAGALDGHAPDEGLGKEGTGDGAGAHASQVILLAICSQGTACAAAIHKGLREVSASTADKYKVAYLLAIAGVFVASFAQMLGAIWVSYNTGERGAAGKKILYASVVTLLLGILLDALAYLLKK